MGVSRKFSSTKGTETLPVLGDLIARTHVLGTITPQEIVLMILLGAYLTSHFSWMSTMSVSSKKNIKIFFKYFYSEHWFTT